MPRYRVERVTVSPSPVKISIRYAEQRIAESVQHDSVLWMREHRVDTINYFVRSSDRPDNLGRRNTFGKRQACRVISREVLKFSILSTLSLITKSSPRPTVSTKSSVTLAASLLSSPAGLTWKNCLIGFRKKNKNRFA